MKAVAWMKGGCAMSVAVLMNDMAPMKVASS